MLLHQENGGKATSKYGKTSLSHSVTGKTDVGTSFESCFYQSTLQKQRARNSKDADSQDADCPVGGTSEPIQSNASSFS